MTETTKLAREGGLFGAVAYVVGYTLTFVLYSIDGNLGTSVPGSSEASSTSGAGWIFYNAHFSDLTVSFQGVTGTVSGSANMLTDTEMVLSGTGFPRSLSWAGTALPAGLFFLVPVAMLTGAGYLLVQRTYVPSAKLAAKQGAAVVAGYLPLAVLGALLFSESIPEVDQSTVEPDMVTAIVFAGLLWPLLFGAIGGYLWFRIHGTASPRTVRRRSSRGR